MDLLLMTRKHKRGKYMRINSVITSWDRGARSYLAVVTFDTTWDIWDCVPLGVKLYAGNVETLARLIQDLALLYPPVKCLSIPLPDYEDETRLFSRILPETAGQPDKTGHFPV